MERIHVIMEKRNLPKNTNNRPNFLVWRRKLQRKEDRDGRRKKEINNTIMKEPVMTEEELVEIINRQRNGKVPGVNGIKAELMKHLIKNKKIRKKK